MKPFKDYDLLRYLPEQEEKMLSKIDYMQNEEIMANDLEILADNLFQEFKINPITICEEDYSKRRIEQKKITRKIDPFFRELESKDYVTVDGIVSYFSYPYQGDGVIFRCQGTTYSLSGYPEIEVFDSYITFRIENTLQEMSRGNAKEMLENTRDSYLESIRRGVSYANVNVNAYNATLREKALSALKSKKKKVEMFYDISKAMEVPVEKKDYAIKHVPLTRKIVPTTKHYKKEDYYCINDHDYQDILDSIKHTASTFERTPASYNSLQEEDLRNILLASLNGIYKGDATGEAFRNGGKTDICIERDNRAAFVAECKMWKGKKEIEPAIRQLDGYLTWRDCKTALVIFVKNRNFFQTLETAEEAIKSIKRIRTVTKKDENEFECLYLSESNPGRQIKIRVMLFNMYSALKG